MVQRGAGVGRQRVQRVEAGVRQRGEGIRAACKVDLALSRTNQVAGKGYTHRACGAGIDDIGRFAGRTENIGDVAGDGGGGHLEHVLLALLALQKTGIITVNAGCTADAASEDYACVMQVALR